MKILYLILLLILPVLAYAGPNTFDAGGSELVLTSSNHEHDMTICLVPDVQNMASQNDFDAVGGKTSCPGLPGYCTGNGCIKSIYCHQSWRNTGNILLRNMAYSLTGQWDKIDYSNIRGNDNVLSKLGHSLDHARCDLILDLGDMTDVPNNSGFGNYVASSRATLDSLDYTYQFNAIKDFLGVIDKSGIPWVINQGNHDPWVWWDDYFTMFGIENKSYFYEREPTWGLSYAVLVPNPTEVPICVVSIGFSDALYDPNAPGEGTRGADVLTWATNVTGCGGDYPTILIAHNQVGEDGEPHSGGMVTPQVVTLTGIAPGTYPGTAGVNEIFMIAGGHWTSSSDTAKTSYTGLFGVSADAAVYGFFSNKQELDRHPSPVDDTGITASDSNGGLYTVIILSPDNNSLCAHDWNPYWQVTNGTSNGQKNGTGTSSECFNFDFYGRFPIP